MSTASFEFDKTAADGTRIASLNQLVIVSGIVLPGIAALTIDSLLGVAFGIAAVLLSLPFTHSGFRGTAMRLFAALLLCSTMLWSNWLIGSRDVAVAAVAAGRVTCVALPGLLLSAHIRPFPLGDALMQQLRLPARPVLAAVMALQRSLLLADQWQELGLVRRSRGLAGRGPAGRVRELCGRTTVFLVLALRQATTLSAAMETRGMQAWERRGVQRGEWRRSRWRQRDTAVCILIVVVSLTTFSTRFFG